MLTSNEQNPSIFIPPNIYNLDSTINDKCKALGTLGNPQIYTFYH